jgi:hypothetical protein
MSPNISLEELFRHKNNYKIYFDCTGIDCFHSLIASSFDSTVGVYVYVLILAKHERDILNKNKVNGA